MTLYSKKVRSTTGETIYEHHNRVWSKHGIDWDHYETHGCAGLVDMIDWNFYSKTHKQWVKGADILNGVVSIDDLAPRSSVLWRYGPTYAWYIKGEYIHGTLVGGSREYFQRAIAHSMESKDNTEVEMNWYEEDRAKYIEAVRARVERQKEERAERDNKSRF